MELKKLIFVMILVFFMLNKNAFSANFYTKSGGAGYYQNSSNWLGGIVPGNNGGYSTSSADTIFINHPIALFDQNFTFQQTTNFVIVVGSSGSISHQSTITKNFTLNGAKIIVDGGTVSLNGNFTTSNPSFITIKNNGVVNVDGNMAINNSNLTIEDGSTLNVDGAFTTSNTSGSVINLSGDMNVGNGMSQIAGTWNVNSTGSLNVTGNLTNDTGSTTFNIAGDVSVSGNTSFHSGNFNINSGGSFLGSGSGNILFGAANITNDGVMNFPNATSQTKYGGTFDCDGTSGGGTVGFGAGSYCGAVCAGGSSSKCVDNGAPLPIELNYFDVSIVGEEFVFKWETLTEENNDFFTVEYSSDLNKFESVLEEKGAGTSLSSITYERNTPIFPFENIIYFRLKQTDFDGNYTYSQIVALSNKVFINAELSIYPNPTKGKTLIKLEKVNEVALQGRVILPSTMRIVEGFQIVNSEAIVDLSNFEKGVYFLQIESMPNMYKLVVQ